jgi:hypothetical protein
VTAPRVLRRVTPGGLLVMTAREIAEDRPGWLAARRFRDGVGYCIGSSDVPSILGVRDSGTPVAVWADKVHGLELPDSDDMYWGRRKERMIAEEWRNRNASAVRNVGMIASAAEPWNQTTLDRMVLECPRSPGLRERCALEVKSRGAFGSRRFHHEVPDDLLGQLCHQIFTTGYDHVHYAVLIGSADYRQGVVDAQEDADTIAYVMRRVRAFHTEHLAGAQFTRAFSVADPDERDRALAGAERALAEPRWPFEDKAASLIETDKLRHPERDGTAEIPDDTDVIELARVRAKLGQLHADEKVLKARLLHAAHGARYLTVPSDTGPQLAGEFTPTHRSKVDLETLRENWPAAYAEVVTQSESWSLKVAKAYQAKATPEEENDGTA